VPATKAAGLQGLRIHDLRDTAVALWIAAGATPKEVAVRAGRTSVSFTLDRYGHQTIPWLVPSSKGLNYGVRQHGRKPQDARSPG
jgi:integrase